VGERAHLIVRRSGDTVAACTDKAGNLSTLRLDFGHNTRYTLGDLFNESTQTQAGGCWCIQLEAPRFPTPTVCQDNNTSLQNATISSRDFWRNGMLTLTLNQTLVGTCEAQPDNLGIYQCELTLREE
jgi:hypothetical protein